MTSISPAVTREEILAKHDKIVSELESTRAKLDRDMARYRLVTSVLYYPMKPASHFNVLLAVMVIMLIVPLFTTVSFYWFLGLLTYASVAYYLVDWFKDAMTNYGDSVKKSIAQKDKELAELQSEKASLEAREIVEALEERVHKMNSSMEKEHAESTTGN